MFKSKIITPFVILFVVCILFIIINIDNLREPEINFDLFKSKKLVNSEINYSKPNNRKIMDYTFEHFGSELVETDGKATLLNIGSDKFNELNEETNKINQELDNKYTGELSKLGDKINSQELDIEKTKQEHEKKERQFDSITSTINKKINDVASIFDKKEQKEEPQTYCNLNEWVDTKDKCICSPEKSYLNKHENKTKKRCLEYPILQYGEYPDDFQNSKLGCINDINYDDAISKCNEAEDCNSFFSYEGKSGPGRVCFKKGADKSKPPKYFKDTGKHPNAGYFFTEDEN